MATEKPKVAATNRSFNFISSFFSGFWKNDSLILKAIISCSELAYLQKKTKKKQIGNISYKRGKIYLSNKEDFKHADGRHFF